MQRSQFEIFLTKKLKTLTVGDEIPLLKILGKDSRRFHGYLISHEDKLKVNIATGKFPLLNLGKFDFFASYKEKLQHFIVM